MAVRTRLNERQWKRVADALCELRSRRGRPPRDDRNFVEAVLWIHRTGAPWRDLPDELGSWKTVYNRFDPWAKTGMWAKLFDSLRTDSDDEWHAIDSTIHRAHQHAAGGKGGLSFTR